MLQKIMTHLSSNRSPLYMVASKTSNPNTINYKSLKCYSPLKKVEIIVVDLEVPAVLKILKKNLGSPVLDVLIK